MYKTFGVDWDQTWCCNVGGNALSTVGYGAPVSRLVSAALGAAVVRGVPLYCDLSAVCDHPCACGALPGVDVRCCSVVDIFL